MKSIIIVIINIIIIIVPFYWSIDFVDVKFVAHDLKIRTELFSNEQYFIQYMWVSFLLFTKFYTFQWFIGYNHQIESCIFHATPMLLF
jgi:hypothetical protein